MLTVLVFLGGCSLVLSAYAADTRTLAERDRGTERISEPTPLPPSPTPVPTPIPLPSSGGITSYTDGSANTGGNEGGTVITGDEYVEVHEVNIGPTNPPPPPPPQYDDEEETAPAPTPECDRRSTSACSIENSGRAR